MSRHTRTTKTRQSTAEQNLAHGLGEIRRIVNALGLPESLRDQACQLFRSAQSEDLLVGRSIEAMAAASVYDVCRCNGLPPTLDGVSEPARVGQASVTNAYKTLNRALGLLAKSVAPTITSSGSRRRSTRVIRCAGGRESRQSERRPRRTRQE